MFTRYLKMTMPWNEKTDRRIVWQKSLQFNYSNRYASLLFPALLLFLKYNAAFLTGYSGNDSEPPFDTNRPTLNTKRPTLVSNRLVLLTNRLALLTNPPILLTDRPILLTNGLVLLTDRPILLTNRPILLTNRPKNDTIPVTIITIRRIILCCFSIAIDYRLTIRHWQRIDHANEVSIFQSTFFFARLNKKECGISHAVLPCFLHFYYAMCRETHGIIEMDNGMILLAFDSQWNDPSSFWLALSVR